MPNLPEETLLRIFSCFQLPPTKTNDLEWSSGFEQRSLAKAQILDEKTLASLCQVSKTFRRIAEPMLYHALLGYDGRQGSMFLRTLSQRPDLARLVRHLDIDGYCEEEFMVQDAFEAAREWLDIPPDLKDGIAEALQSDNDSQQGEIAFFVSMTPNLQSLQITMPESKGILLSLFRAFASDKTGTRFSKLHELGLRYWDTEDAICMCEVDDLLLAPPALDTFCGFAVNWCKPPETPRPLGFEHISLQHSLIDGPGLSSLLSRCHRLRTLSVTWGNVWVGDCDLDWDEMGDALRLHAPLLERLHLDPILAFRYTDEESTGRIGSLEQLTRLKELELPLEILVGRMESPASGSGNTLHSLAQLLPASLESLHLYLTQDGAEELGEELSKLLEVGSQLANLREIRVAGPGSWRLCIKLVDGVMVKENVWERHLIPPPIAAFIPRRL